MQASLTWSVLYNRTDLYTYNLHIHERTPALSACTMYIVSARNAYLLNCTHSTLSQTSEFLHRNQGCHGGSVSNGKKCPVSEPDTLKQKPDIRSSRDRLSCYVEIESILAQCVHHTSVHLKSLF